MSRFHREVHEDREEDVSASTSHHSSGRAEGADRNAGGQESKRPLISKAF
jgi:hypothetical protein